MPIIWGPIIVVFSSFIQSENRPFVGATSWQYVGSVFVNAGILSLLCTSALNLVSLSKPCLDCLSKLTLIPIDSTLWSTWPGCDRNIARKLPQPYVGVVGRDIYLPLRFNFWCNCHLGGSVCRVQPLSGCACGIRKRDDDGSHHDSSDAQGYICFSWSWLDSGLHSDQQDGNTAHRSAYI